MARKQKKESKQHKDMQTQSYRVQRGRGRTSKIERPCKPMNLHVDVAYRVHVVCPLVMVMLGCHHVEKSTWRLAVAHVSPCKPYYLHGV